MWGEDASVVGDEYRGSSELDDFLDNPATKEERDWRAIKDVAGIPSPQGSKG